MKRKLVGVLCACLLLLGCGDISSQPNQTTPPETEIITEIPTETSPLPLLEQGIVLDESGNLRYIPNVTIEGLISPEMHLFGNGLLVSAYSENMLSLNHISLEDGALITSTSLTAGHGAKLCFGSGEIGLCDRESGSVLILDEDFQLLRSYDLSLEGDEWYLNSELDTLYVFYSDRGLLALNLESGEELWLVDDGFRVTPRGDGSGYVIFEYTDRDDQKTYTRCLNLSVATLETLPVDGGVSDCIRQGETWLIQKHESEDHILVQGEDSYSFTWEESDVRMLSPKRHLLVSDPSGRNLTLYEADGAFLSRCALPQNDSHAVVGQDFVWSGYWQGYFFTDYIGSSSRLMFWDVNAPCEGEDLQMSDPEAIQQVQPVLERQLYERAEELSQRFGLDIRIAEQCSLDYSHYDTYALPDPGFIRSSLDILEDCLAQYPDGFFHQLLYGPIESIRIELVGGLTAKEDNITHPSAHAFVSNRGSYYIVVFDGYMLQNSIVFHEFSHIIDDRLEWDSMIREDALYSEETWLSLQPEGFYFAFSYVDVPEELNAYMDSGYFIRDYALTYPTEDRAVLIASAMENNIWDFEPGSGSRRKLQYYADCIRDCFNTDGWPEVTRWEQVLQ